jgi:hypothetical protein
MPSDPENLDASGVLGSRQSMSGAVINEVHPMRHALGTWKGNEHVGRQRYPAPGIATERSGVTYDQDDERQLLDMDEDDPRLDGQPIDPIPDSLRESWAWLDLGEVAEGLA